VAEDKKTSELDQKKQELQRELKRLQGELDQSLDDVKTDVTSQLDPRELVRKHPLVSLGTSVALGFLFGHKGRNAKTARSAGGDGLGSLLWDELKTTATRRGVRLLFKYLDQALDLDEDDSVSSAQAPSNGQSKG